MEKNTRALQSLPTEKTVKISALKRSSNYKMSRQEQGLCQFMAANCSSQGRTLILILGLSSLCNIKVWCFYFCFCLMIIKVDVRFLVYIMPLVFLQHSYQAKLSCQSDGFQKCLHGSEHLCISFNWLKNTHVSNVDILKYTPGKAMGVHWLYYHQYVTKYM